MTINAGKAAAIFYFRRESGPIDTTNNGGL